MKGKICFPHETHILVKFITIFCKSFFSPQRLHLVKEKKKKSINMKSSTDLKKRDGKNLAGAETSWLFSPKP